MTRDSRVAFLFWFQVMAFFLLGARLIDLQLIKGERNRILANENRVKKMVLPAGRGIIYDSLGRPLVENIPFYLLGQKDDQFSWRPITRLEALEMEAQGGDGKENLRVEVSRRYLFGPALAHLIGFVQEARKEEIGELISRGDLVGRGGIEQQYDALLRGVNGWEVFETDALGNQVRSLGKVDPRAGRDLRLTIDAHLSQAAYEALGDQAGAVIVSRPLTGEILVLISTPSFDPTRLAMGLNVQDYQEILEDPRRPFFNRAIGGVYPPGSVFKIVTAAAGLEEGKIIPETLINDTGVIRIGDFVYRNWYFTQYGRTEGEINLVTALKRSTDTFFYKVGEWVGPELLALWATRFGLGEKTGLDLPGEVGGLVPDPEWKKEIRGERWFLGNTYHFAIGQADLTATPLQINQMTAVIAGQGQWCRPKVAKQRKTQCQDLGLSGTTVAAIREGMKEACSEGGTAYPLFDFDPAVACKTGTAQFGFLSEDSEKNQTHAWLTAFAPVENPEVAITVLVEAGGEGSRDAAPVAKKILEEWFGRI
ncbi:MAG: hypothetical protein JW991_05120 [Candidatus Pacebacteria bacterium]|nr:hypothetical protein [Candidatus Paceibacterota bacterium]